MVMIQTINACVGEHTSVGLNEAYGGVSKPAGEFPWRTKIPSRWAVPPANTVRLPGRNDGLEDQPGQAPRVHRKTKQPP